MFIWKWCKSTYKNKSPLKGQILTLYDKVKIDNKKAPETVLFVLLFRSFADGIQC